MPEKYNIFPDITKVSVMNGLGKGKPMSTRPFNYFINGEGSKEFSKA
jgi:hypothetical protein